MHARRRELDRERKAVEPAADLGDRRRPALKSGLDGPSALRAKSSTAPRSASGGTAYSCSPDVQRLAARHEQIAGSGRRRAGRRPVAASSTCSKLSSTSSSSARPQMCRRGRPAHRAPARSSPGRAPGRAARRAATQKTPSGNSRDALRGGLSASRVLPVPPGPVSVTSRRRRARAARALRRARVAADKRRRRHRQVRPVERLQRRELVVAELEEPLRRSSGP